VRVPFEFIYGGEAGWIKDTLSVPKGVARIIIHQSMYRMDPITNLANYRLGCKELDIPTSDIPVEDTRRIELIDRECLTPDRQFGARDRQGRTLKPVTIHNPIRRVDPLTVSNPRPNENGASQGEYGDRR
jgi:hypothetical protein